MKHKWNYPEPVQTRSKMVRGLGELQDTPKFRDWLEREFPAGSAEMKDGDEQGVSRRSFMRLMGASTALAGFGVAACRRPETHIRPFSKALEWSIPGNLLYYATAMPRLGGCQPIVVTTNEGKPTHLEGNPLYPGAKGLDSLAASSVLDLYCPERSGAYLHDGKTVTAEDFSAALSGLKGKLADGKGLALLVGESTSPTRAAALKKVAAKYPQAKIFRYEPINNETANAVNDVVLGKGVRPVYDFSKAKRVLSIGADFLGVDRVSDDAVTAFSRARKVDDTATESHGMNRLYVLEHTFTLTGGMADHRLPVHASQLLAATAAIAKAVGAAAGDSALSGLAAAAGSPAAIDADWVKHTVADLIEHKGASLVLAGSRLDSGVHVLVAGINAALQNFGSTIKPVQTETDDAGTLADLEKAIASKEVSTLVITTEADPVFDAPSQNFGELLKSVENVIHLGVRDKTATARAAKWHVPGTHYLESWGDVRASDGTYSIVQPMILPLYGGVSEISLLLDLAADAPKEGDEAAAVPAAPVADAKEAALLLVEETFAAVANASGITDVAQAWNKALRDGFAAGTAYKPASAKPNVAGGKSLIVPSTAPAPNKDAFEVVFTADSKVYDGRYINNAWQQEAPDPISKVVWDNAALISVRTLSELGLSQADIATLVDEDETRILKITLNDKEMFVPFIALPGHAQHSISISMGYGQKDPGKVGGGNDGSGTGFNGFPLRTAETSYIATGAKVELVEEKVKLSGREDQDPVKIFKIALTQQHSSMEDRAISRDGTIAEYEESKEGWEGRPDKPTSVFQKRGMDSHAPKNIQIYKGQTFDYENLHQWAMAIDLNSCIGCNACLVSCQSENNIPVVGKEQVMIGREMHWIRMDRYFTAEKVDDEKDIDLDNPQMLTQPMACQHCEAAPCETVCPVNATVHNEEGLNTMAYNRCIGTRYCMNNCPYKARRFNFFDYNKRPLDQLYMGPASDKDQTGMRESVKLQKNPNVTVRMRGVVEKCTYCVQRLQEGKIKQKQIARDSKENLKVKDGTVKTACQTACPAEAITFGDLGTKDSNINKWKASPRNYDVLHFLGTRPRTSYLAKLKNPNLDMPGAELVGTVTKTIH
jgi:MoCo/4Fe-4S cofactor protein with predicted Tat translocation signal